MIAPFIIIALLILIATITVIVDQIQTTAYVQETARLVAQSHATVARIQARITETLDVSIKAS